MGKRCQAVMRMAGIGAMGGFGVGLLLVIGTLLGTGRDVPARLIWAWLPRGLAELAFLGAIGGALYAMLVAALAILARESRPARWLLSAAGGIAALTMFFGAFVLAFFTRAGEEEFLFTIPLFILALLSTTLLGAGVGRLATSIARMGTTKVVPERRRSYAGHRAVPHEALNETVSESDITELVNRESKSDWGGREVHSGERRSQGS